QSILLSLLVALPIFAQLVCAYVTDMVLYGLDTAKVAYIISEKAHEISDSIVGQMDGDAPVHLAHNGVGDLMGLLADDVGHLGGVQAVEHHVGDIGAHQLGKDRKGDEKGKKYAL